MLPRSDLEQGNEMKRRLPVILSLMALLLAFVAANLSVGSGSTTTVVDAARSACEKDGFPVQSMAMREVSTDSGLFGFGGRANVEFVRTGLGPWAEDQPRLLRVELRRPMNLLKWEAVNVRHDP
jgi:hypothetical protein